MKNIVIANWKMNGVSSDWRLWAEHTAQTADKLTKTNVVLCPPAAGYALVGPLLKEKPSVFLGSQAINEHEKGAYTAETSTDMLIDFGGTYTLVGHSEYRERTYHCATRLNAQVKKALEAKIIPVLCIGESAQSRQNGTVLDDLKTQLDEALEGVTLQSTEDLLIAYEPIWGIKGDNFVKTPEVDDMPEVYDFLRQYVKDRFKAHGETLALLYGGSVDAGNVDNFMQQLDIQGVLVGSASLKSDVFADILRQIDK